MGAESRRAILGIPVSLYEHKVHWIAFLQSLVEREFRRMEFITSGVHQELKPARKAVFGGLPWQRCQLHLHQNTQAYLPR